MKQVLLMIILAMGALAGCERMETVQEQHANRLAAIPEIKEEYGSARQMATSVSAYLVFKVTRPVSTTGTNTATGLAYTNAAGATGDVRADSVTTKKGWTKFSIKSDKIGQYVKKKADPTKTYHWYILDRDYKIYREVGFTGLNESTFNWINYYKNAVVIDGADRPIVQSTKREPLQ